MKVAITHDWLYGGGAEKVALELHRMYPEAPIYTSYCSDEWRQKLDGKVVTGYLQNWPFAQLRKFLPVLRQRWFRNLDLSDYDLIISSSGNGEAKFARATKPGAKHICYCHSPTHFYWRHYDSYLENPGFGPKPLVRAALKLLVGPLRKRDYQAAQQVDYFVANSNHIKNDIETYYMKEAEVIHPPVDVARFADVEIDKQRTGFVTMGRLVPQKRVDLVIAACNKLQVPLKVIGSGPELTRLQAMAGTNISFKTNVTDEQMPDELKTAQAFVFAAEEDFGIAPVEAMAAGLPVIAYGQGGALDYVVPGKTGELFDSQTLSSLVAAIKEFKPANYTASDIKNHAQKFSRENFQKNLSAYIKNVIQ